MMEDKFEQYVCFKVLCKPQQIGYETSQKGFWQIFFWSKTGFRLALSFQSWFKMMSVLGDQLLAKHQKKIIKKLIHDDCHQTIHKLSHMIGINYEVY